MKFLNQLLGCFKKKNDEPKTIHLLWENQHGWGWNVYISTCEQGKITRATGHHPDRYSWKVGDEVREKMQSGRIGRFKITSFEPGAGVHDQFFLSLSWIGYADTEEVLEKTFNEMGFQNVMQ